MARHMLMVPFFAILCALPECVLAQSSQPQWSPPERPGSASSVKSRARRDARELIQLLQNPKPLTNDAIETFAQARALYREGLFEDCQEELADFWKKNPRNAAEWGSQGETVGFKLGYPCVYPGLVLLTDAVAWRIKEKDLPKPVKAIHWNIGVLLVGKSKGFMPSNDVEAKAGKGTPVSKSIDPQLLANDHQLLHDTIWLTREYYRAVTEGKINLRLAVFHLKDLEFNVSAPGGPGERTEDFAKLKAAIPPSVAKLADWYWLIYPEIGPPRGGEYYLASYPADGQGTPGGVTSLPGTNNTMFMCQDHWLTRRLAEDGFGPVHPLARQIYLPYWLQHEFFHDHYGRNSHLKLEEESHIWFDRTKWPSDFVGRFEPDYYQESMFKRLQQQAKPSLAAYFIRRSIWSGNSREAETVGFSRALCHGQCGKQMARWRNQIGRGKPGVDKRRRQELGPYLEGRWNPRDGQTQPLLRTEAPL